MHRLLRSFRQQVALRAVGILLWSCECREPAVGGDEGRKHPVEKTVAVTDINVKKIVGKRQRRNEAN